ncbi:MAG: tRNA epoxyqueuosine(34) reductase QueG [Alphaproteobacteria bacterium]|jgi:epoxyqueuosine reductase|nr:tRNA epoxyqueuosine(34) reductase QueG [Alphaproteobacteria bacterium]
MATSISERLRARAAALGFDAVGFAEADSLAGDNLAAFVAAGLHGDMGWLADTLERRRHPRALWPEAKSAVMVGLSYAPAEDPLALLAQADRGGISVYARNRDYHDLLKGKLKQLAGWMVAKLGGEVKVFCDTAPLMEKPLAAMAGIGWQGKHTNLVSREHGSWLFLGAVLTTLDLPADPPAADRCGSCRRCLDICPTGALPAPYRIDARRCISYLTIEHKGHIPRDLRPLMGNRIYGCDDCLAVCPWNRFAHPTAEAKLIGREALTGPRLAELAALDDAGFRALFAGSPVKRTGRDRFLRNVLIAIGNSGDADLAASAEACLDDASPLVRAMAVWALAQLMPKQAFVGLHDLRAADENDPDVSAEWSAG